MMATHLIHLGTPCVNIENVDTNAYVPVWKQEATDERGRKRFHGAFTGGFSAGYFNTVGTKEGWTPSQFASSRTDRFTPSDKQTTALNTLESYMDEEDRQNFGMDKTLFTKEEFDTESHIGRQ